MKFGKSDLSVTVIICPKVIEKYSFWYLAQRSKLSCFFLVVSNGFRMPLLQKEGKLKCSTFPLRMEKLQWGLPEIGRYLVPEPKKVMRDLHF